MARRLKLHEELEQVLGSKNVYFQPPESTKLKYPCIKYELDKTQTIFADNNPYHFTTRYTITLITRDPDNEIHERLLRSFKMCVHNRTFTADNLYHYVYELYFG